MPSDQNESELSPDAPNVYGKKDLDGVARWIKNLGALVTISVAFAGLWFTAYQLKVADSERGTPMNEGVHWNDTATQSNAGRTSASQFV
jgi:hypothetical protein